MPNTEEQDDSSNRMKRFAEIYREKMEKRPYMEILARYDSMTEAHLLVSERELADRYVDTGKLDELIDFDGKSSRKPLRSVS